MLRLEHFKPLFKSAPTEIKAFLYRQRWKEALIFFFFMLLALGFWLLQSLQEEYEIEISIPVRYMNVPPEIAFTETVPDVITATVKDKGSVLLNYSFGRGFAPIEANMKGMSKSDGMLLIKKKKIESDILKQLLSTTTLISFEPLQIEASYNRRKESERKVTFDGEIQTDEGFLQSGSIEVTPRKVKVYATGSVLDTLSNLKTVFTQVKDANKTLSLSLQLAKVEGVTMVPEIVTVTIPIEEYTEKTLVIPVVCTDLPPHYTLRTFPASVKVTCNIPLSLFKSLSEEGFAVCIPYSSLEQNVSGSLPVTLSKKPEEVDNVTISPNKVEFILEHNNK